VRKQYLGGILVASMLATAGACGGSWWSTSRITSSEPNEVCVARTDGVVRDDGSPWITCFNPGAIDADLTYVVGECIETKHAAESAAVIDARSAACPS
jgi:hypothetical protein